MFSRVGMYSTMLSALALLGMILSIAYNMHGTNSCKHTGGPRPRRRGSHMARGGRRKLTSKEADHTGPGLYVTTVNSPLSRSFTATSLSGFSLGRRRKRKAPVR
jgi:hypothetical protein